MTSTDPARRAAPTSRAAVALAALLDIAAVFAFATSGRSSHQHGLTFVGIVQTAWPFLLALAIMWLVARVWRRPTAILRSGVPLWIGTVALGMILRVLLTDGGAPIAFIIVATTVLGLMLVGWRAIRALIRRMRARNRA